ncbi:MAG: glycosyl transferase, partial [Campylobacterota bacterium]|nr:glycosyl transferase [Campylobacterota bacterium]
PTVLNTAIGDTVVTSRFYKYTCIQGSFTNEYFQYIDKPRGKWIHANREGLLKK